MTRAAQEHVILDLRFAPLFLKAVLPVLRNPQLRKNVAHAIDVIQAKRAWLVPEKTDWQELRAAAAAIRTYALENLGAYPIRKESQPQPEQARRRILDCAMRQAQPDSRI